MFFSLVFIAGARAGTSHPADTLLDSIVKNFESAEAAGLSKSFDETMIGYTQLQESVKAALNSQKQVKIKLGVKKFTKAKDIYVIQCDWVKTYLLMPNLTAQKVSGRTLFLFQLKNKQWKLASMSGDNIFSL